MQRAYNVSECTSRKVLLYLHCFKEFEIEFNIEINIETYYFAQLRGIQSNLKVRKGTVLIVLAYVCPCHFQVQLAHVAAEAELKVPYVDELPSRQAQLTALKTTEEFDVLVVGGGATGAGCALDAVTRSKLAVNICLLSSTSLSRDVTGFKLYNCPY